MKKILACLGILILLQNVGYCAQQNMSFVYINGSNNNDEKMKNWYEEGVHKFHPLLKKRFEKNRDTKIFYNTKNGLVKINEDPIIFFWGNKSKDDLEWVKKHLDFSQAIGAMAAYKVRSMLTAYLHDAIWVQKDHNMIPILDELNQVVQQEYAKGNRVTLFGYSAGTFVTYQYMFRKLPYLNLQELFEIVKVDEETKNFIKANPQNDTCISALQDAQIGVVTDSGRLIIDPSQNFKTNYLKLDESTNRVCAPQYAISSVVNFASPLVLFYSDLTDPNYEMSYYNALMVKYILEKGISFLTVNYKEDPLGFPTFRNLTNEELEKVINITIENPTGMVFDNSKIWGKRSVIFAHTSYWNNNFANSVVKSYVKGMKFNYNEKYQEKMLKKRSKDFNIWE